MEARRKREERGKLYGLALSNEVTPSTAYGSEWNYWESRLACTLTPAGIRAGIRGGIGRNSLELLKSVRMAVFLSFFFSFFLPSNFHSKLAKQLVPNNREKFMVWRGP